MINYGSIENNDLILKKNLFAIFGVCENAG